MQLREEALDERQAAIEKFRKTEKAVQMSSKTERVGLGNRKSNCARKVQEALKLAHQKTVFAKEMRYLVLVLRGTQRRMAMKPKAVEEKIPPTGCMASTGIPGDLPLHCFAALITEVGDEKEGKPKQKRTSPKCKDTVGKKKAMAKKG